MELSNGNAQTFKLKDVEVSNGTGKTFTIIMQEPILVCPAEETFNGLYFLSNLDQTFPQPIEIIFTYKGSEIQQENATEVLKESLAKILVKFYPFAGCLTTSWDGKMLVRCTGEGVPFVEAVSDNKIEELGDISIADAVKLRKLIHYNEEAENILDVPLLTVQVTKFKCGGIILGVRMNHVLIDGKGLADFLLSWAEIARGLPLSIHPHLDRSIFTPRQPLEIDIPHPEYIQRERAKKTTPLHNQEPLVYRSFCFELKKIAQLKKMANDDEFKTPPTSFEVISALVWTFWTKAFEIKPDQTTKILTAVDGRPKFKSLAPKCFFGNGIAWSCAQCKAGELMQKPFSFAVKIVHDAIKKVTEDYIRSAIDYYELTRGELETENTCHISKWSRLPFYDTNFGWGEPTQVAPASLVDNLILTLSQGKDTKNIIVSLSLPESVMEIFQELMQSELKRK